MRAGPVTGQWGLWKVVAERQRGRRQSGWRAGRMEGGDGDRGDNDGRGRSVAEKRGGREVAEIPVAQL